jgi:hypothetical protein
MKWRFSSILSRMVDTRMTEISVPITTTTRDPRWYDAGLVAHIFTLDRFGALHIPVLDMWGFSRWSSSSTVYAGLPRR